MKITITPVWFILLALYHISLIPVLLILAYNATNISLFVILLCIVCMINITSIILVVIPQYQSISLYRLFRNIVLDCSQSHNSYTQYIPLFCFNLFTLFFSPINTNYILWNIAVLIMSIICAVLIIFSCLQFFRNKSIHVGIHHITLHYALFITSFMVFNVGTVLSAWNDKSIISLFVFVITSVCSLYSTFAITRVDRNIAKAVVE